MRYDPHKTWIVYQLIVSFSCVGLVIINAWLALHVVKFFKRLSVVVNIENLEARVKWKHQ